MEVRRLRRWVRGPGQGEGSASTLCVTDLLDDAAHLIQG